MPASEALRALHSGDLFTSPGSSLGRNTTFLLAKTGFHCHFPLPFPLASNRLQINVCVCVFKYVYELETLDVVPMLSDVPQVALSLYSPYLPRKGKKKM